MVFAVGSVQTENMHLTEGLVCVAEEHTYLSVCLCWVSLCSHLSPRNWVVPGCVHSYLEVRGTEDWRPVKDL